jgi:hypothetical protein
VLAPALVHLLLECGCLLQPLSIAVGMWLLVRPLSVGVWPLWCSPLSTVAGVAAVWCGLPFV